jgi:hypothetical protein
MNKPFSDGQTLVTKTHKMCCHIGILEGITEHYLQVLGGYLWPPQNSVRHSPKLSKADK